MDVTEYNEEQSHTPLNGVGESVSWGYMKQLGYLGVYRLKQDKPYRYCSAGEWKTKVWEPYRKGTYVKV